MPVYRYHCEDCEVFFEMSRRITDSTLPECPECGSDNTHKTVTQSSFVLKGSGWYATDYGKKTSCASGSCGHASHSSSSASDSKPAESSCPKADTCPAAGACKE